MNYSFIQPKKNPRTIQYFCGGKLVGVYKRPFRGRRKPIITRRQFEEKLEQKLTEETVQ